MQTEHRLQRAQRTKGIQELGKQLHDLLLEDSTLAFPSQQRPHLPGPWLRAAVSSGGQSNVTQSGLGLPGAGRCWKV